MSLTLSGDNILVGLLLRAQAREGLDKGKKIIHVQDIKRTTQRAAQLLLNNTGADPSDCFVLC